MTGTLQPCVLPAANPTSKYQTKAANAKFKDLIMGKPKVEGWRKMEHAYEAWQSKILCRFGGTALTYIPGVP
eukprot:scaffold66826_cov60-Cyclotella_meneghiniana.AAC.1